MQRGARFWVRARQAVVISGVVLVVFGTASQGGQQPPTRSRLDSSDVQVLRLRMEAGFRSGWHSHSGWQILMAEEGRGRVQARGGPIEELLPGRPFYAAPGTVHWHGAAPDEYFMQLAFYTGEVTGLEPVSDEDYLGR
jgi:4-carboxymuconolactone decarboxylase